MTKRELTLFIKSEAHRIGFDACGITKAKAVDKATVAHCTKWIGEQRNGTMHYLERNCDKRYNPTLLVTGCKSIISVALNYAPHTPIEGISYYAQGDDYHKIVKDKLFTLLSRINEKTTCTGRAFCDSAPVLERYWAVKAGLGWIGRNHQLIIPGKGSFFFLGELLIDTELDYDTPFAANHCGTCSKCIDNCPTAALGKENFDARKCLSYLTIEHRDKLPENIGEKMLNCFYGCDRCQTSCPHNKFASPTRVAAFSPKPELQQMQPKDWHTLTEEQYNKLFAHSAVERCGYEQLMRNINACKNSTK